jgi:tRNA pseudouridine55 synthase
VKFGATTETDDPESPEVPTPGAAPVTLAQIRAAAGRFVGDILQRPPAYSAMKVGGRRSYDLAREGELVRHEARPVRVYAIEILAYDWPLLRVRIDCGRGTYVRSIARDLGETLGVGGFLTQLRRTRVGPFHADTAIALDRITANGPAAHVV